MKNKNLLNKGFKVITATLVLGSVLNIGIYVGAKHNNQSFAQPINKTITEKNISKEKAKEIILSKANGELIYLEDDSEDNEYEGKVKKDNVIYEVDVDKSSGNINKFEEEVENDEDINNEVKTTDKNINEEKAKEIILSKVKGELISLKYDRKDNEYEGKIKKDNFIYEIEISGTNGQVIDIEKESINNDLNDYDIDED